MPGGRGDRDSSPEYASLFDYCLRSNAARTTLYSKGKAGSVNVPASRTWQPCPPRETATASVRSSFLLACVGGGGGVNGGFQGSSQNTSEGKADGCIIRKERSGGVVALLRSYCIVHLRWQQPTHGAHSTLLAADVLSSSGPGAAHPEKTRVYWLDRCTPRNSAFICNDFHGHTLTKRGIEHTHARAHTHSAQSSSGVSAETRRQEQKIIHGGGVARRTNRRRPGKRSPKPRDQDLSLYMYSLPLDHTHGGCDTSARAHEDYFRRRRRCRGFWR